MTPEIKRGIAALRPNPRALRRWSAALRSGKYSQISGDLCRRAAGQKTNCMCVLGVGIDANWPEWNGSEGDGYDVLNGGEIFGLDLEQMMTPVGVAPYGQPLHFDSAFYSENDRPPGSSRRRSFADFANDLDEIADLVEGKNAGEAA